jgi:hypothetical protein
MKRFAVEEGWVWLALVALTLFGFVNYEAHGLGVAYVVLGVGLAKFSLIFFDFMEMKHAHGAWKAAMLLFMVALFAAISFNL